MARFRHPLDHVQVAAPCKADWEQMIGSERMRFCGACNLNVYNLSGMTRFEAESLIARNEGRLCVRFYRRFDGSIITKDCPVGLRAIQRRVSYFVKAVAAAGLTFLASIGFHQVLPGVPAMSSHPVLGAISMPAEYELIQGAMPVDRDQPTIGKIYYEKGPRRKKRSRN